MIIIKKVRIFNNQKYFNFFKILIIKKLEENVEDKDDEFDMSLW